MIQKIKLCILSAFAMLCIQQKRRLNFFFFELMFNIPVNSKGHVGTLPPLYGTFTQNEDVMTSNKCFKNQRTNGPVNAHLSLLHIPINMFEYYGI